MGCGLVGWVGMIDVMDCVWTVLFLVGVAPYIPLFVRRGWILTFAVSFLMCGMCGCGCGCVVFASHSHWQDRRAALRTRQKQLHWSLDHHHRMYGCRCIQCFAMPHPLFTTGGLMCEAGASWQWEWASCLDVEGTSCSLFAIIVISCMSTNRSSLLNVLSVYSNL